LNRAARKQDRYDNKFARKNKLNYSKKLRKSGLTQLEYDSYFEEY
jgi:hypothetical protein